MSTRYAVAKDVVDHGLYRDTPNPEIVAAQADTANREDCFDPYLKTIEGAVLDGLTAQALVLVYEALSPASQAKFDAVPMQRLIAFCWSKVTIGSQP